MKHILLQVILGVILIGVIVLISVKARATEEPFKQIELSNNNSITNTVSIPYLDTIMSVGLDEMGIAGITLVISDLSDASKNQFNGELKAHIRYFNGVYYLFTDKFGRNESIEVISHEIIHIFQYNTGKLYYDESGQVFWDGEAFDLENVEYDKRPWERDAFSQSGKLYSRIHDKLVAD